MQERTQKLGNRTFSTFFYKHAYQFLHGNHFATYYTFVRVCVCSVYFFGLEEMTNIMASY